VWQENDSILIAAGGMNDHPVEAAPLSFDGTWGTSARL
jgi:hypothetical protein